MWLKYAAYNPNLKKILAGPTQASYNALRGYYARAKSHLGA